MEMIIDPKDNKKIIMFNEDEERAVLIAYKRIDGSTSSKVVFWNLIYNICPEAKETEWNVAMFNGLTVLYEI